MNSLSYLNHDQHGFPPPEQALRDPNGLLAVGGDLRPERLLNAYYNGIFPWFNLDDPILWWSPDPRAVFVPGNMKISRSLLKYLKKQNWTYTINHQFKSVMAGCAAPRAKQDGTWISEEIQQAYYALHQQGRAHSLEVWQGEELIGGLYGINIGQVFCGESMFHRATNASKAAMIVLQQHLQRCGYRLIDAQVVNPHLDSLGAKSIKRDDFLRLLTHLRDGEVNPDSWCKSEVFIEL
ncbi:leucyl/phenylalanyl-tRNA--protein transferase [Shewanella fidelis]|uniref:Leucyl/phenylalanyl-tRNA--protein transferase n=1 Tax=Shewanella fidelis TaxID=173509 RepID=A0AAW8NNU8_9GAMM|nr:leucyl/phenylalanyl-tRNA--protein transferase [Shewanella fidelis]MDR8524196.1 leucyl/phenylalanyl-tRNA--protein transferase [Shewanella fidelis]MDW4810743.1 leucyl/phenylalanyl-tRNA--protein transferase [Shewanella fidelis]MDW4814864.1 leucyl/phenylalanyl-tRNA--protein transferase [Shewanella fidelis]MDW4818954.1 leucyl/phenylalanyl-tRNA--protein transferase [Shewanella fidelis]MDW4823369.1 leucyl/phenylalanyl-tRNA--protein transferase [Shewanella fidelis]